jgi:hypothetical protein
VRSDGVVVLQADDPLLADVARFVESDNELSLFLGSEGDRPMTRVTIGRCDRDDSFVAVYGGPLEADVPLRFVV